MRRTTALAVALLAAALVSAGGSARPDGGTVDAAHAEIFSAADGHRIAGFAIDAGWLSIAGSQASRSTPAGCRSPRTRLRPGRARSSF
jgi:hypothetical protein